MHYPKVTRWSDEFAELVVAEEHNEYVFDTKDIERLVAYRNAIRANVYGSYAEDTQLFTEIVLTHPRRVIRKYAGRITR